MGWLQNLKARRLRKEQNAKLMEHARAEEVKTAEFLQLLGERIVHEHLPTRCTAVYEMILDWCGNNTCKQKQAALYLFIWEVEEKKRAMSWEVIDIAFELAETQRNRSNPLVSGRVGS